MRGINQGIVTLIRCIVYFISVLFIGSCGSDISGFAADKEIFDKDSVFGQSIEYAKGALEDFKSVFNILYEHDSDKAKNFYVFLLVNGLDGNPDALENYKSELEFFLKKQNRHGVAYVMHDRSGDVPHKSFDEQLSIFRNEVVRKLNKSDVREAMEQGKDIVVVFIGHSQGGVIIHEFWNDCKSLQNLYNIKQAIFVMVTSPLGGIDGDPAKMRELREKLLAAFRRILEPSNIYSFLMWMIERAINRNLNHEDLPCVSKLPGVKALSTHKRQYYTLNTDFIYPTLVVQAQCDGIQLLRDAAAERSPVPKSYIDEFVMQLSDEEKSTINKLWGEVLDHADKHDGVVPFDSQKFCVDDVWNNGDSTEKKFEVFKIKASHRSVLENHDVIAEAYDFAMRNS